MRVTGDECPRALVVGDTAASLRVRGDGHQAAAAVGAVPFLRELKAPVRFDHHHKRYLAPSKKRLDGRSPVGYGYGKERGNQRCEKGARQCTTAAVKRAGLGVGMGTVVE